MNEEEIHRLITSGKPDTPAPKGGREREEPSRVQASSAGEAFLGEIPRADGYAHLQGECGDSMEVFLTIREDRVEKARFDTLGCDYTIACGAMAMQMAEGQTVREALRIDAVDISQALGFLPPSHEHCAELAAETLRRALEDSLRRRKDPWKQLYRPR